MCHMKPSERKSSSSSGKESGNWTLVDEGGEEVQQMTSFFSFFPFMLLLKLILLIIFVCVCEMEEEKLTCSFKKHHLKLRSVLLSFYLCDITVDSGASRNEY